MISEAIRSKYRTLNKIKDVEFDVDKLATYSLILSLSDKDFSILVVDTIVDRALYLEHIQFEELLSEEDVIRQLSLLFDEHHFLKAGFWKKIKLVVRNKCFAFVPNSLYSEEKRQYFLDLNAEVPEEYHLFSSRFSSSDATCVFGLNSSLNQWIQNIYPSKEVKIDHTTNVLVDSVTKQVAKKEGYELFVYSDSRTLTITLLKDGHLHYCNVFSYDNAEDYTYFIMLVVHEFALNPEQVPVSLYGDIEQTSIYFTKLYKYLRFLQFGKRPEGLKFGFVFDEVFDYQYFDLYSAYIQS